jgi:hypothetical protein
LQGKSDPLGCRGDVSRLAASKGTGKAILMWALTVPQRATRSMVVIMEMLVMIAVIVVSVLVVVLVMVDVVREVVSVRRLDLLVRGPE